MRNLLLSILSIVMLNSCSKGRLTTKGDRITETRILNEFTSVVVSGAIRVNLNYGNEYKVVLKGSSNLIPYFKTTLNGRNLNLSYKNVNINHDDIEIYKGNPQLDSKISGSGKLIKLN